MKKRLKVDVLIANLLAIVLWASAFVGIRAGLVFYSPLHLAFLRLLIGSIGLVIFTAFRKIQIPDLKDIPVFLLTGFFGFTVYHISLNIGEMTVSAGLSSLIVTLAPVFTGILATFFLNERLTIIGLIGTMIGFAGVAMISISVDGSFHFSNGVLWILLAAFSESIYFIIQTPYLKKYDIISFTTYTIWAGTLFMFFVSPGVVSDILSAPISTNLIVLYLGIFPTVIAYLALAYAVSRVGSSKGTSSIYLTPVLAFIIAWICLKEVPSLLSIVGGIITIVGVLLVNHGVVEKGQNLNKI